MAVVRGKQREKDAELDQAYKEACEARGELADFLYSDFAALGHLSIYRDAMCSLATVGMITPFIEGLFRHFFKEYGKQISLDGAECRIHPDAWNCETYFSKTGSSKGIYEGIVQLSRLIGLKDLLPLHFLDRLKVLIIYRNRMFHQSVEWTNDDRDKFRQVLVQDNLPTKWFRHSSSNNKIWIYYVSDEFIDDLLVELHWVVDAMVRLYKSRKPPPPPPPDYIMKLIRDPLQ